MRCHRFSVLLAACASFLAVQLGGLHLHVDADGNIGNPHGVHLHIQGYHSHGDLIHVHRADTAHEQAAEHEHSGDGEHAGDSDLLMAELSNGKWKFSDLILIAHQGPAFGQVEAGQVRPARAEPRPPIRKARWRPPLRAPPNISSLQIV